MYTEITDTKVPIKVWAIDLEKSALVQATTLANSMPIHHHLSLMPDAHAGIGMCIGGVLPLDNAISVAAVGTDIGCGMRAMRTSRRDIAMEDLKKIYKLIRKTVPVGFNEHKHPVMWSGFDSMPAYAVLERERWAAAKQIGTCGSGNHFLEFQKGSDGYIWVMLHSGSRHLGYAMEKYYLKLAQEKGIVPENQDLAYFSLDTALGQEYWHVMNFCLEFARENRRVMMERVIDAMTSVLDVQVEDVIDIHHNYAAIETHFGKSVVVHRKGATLATRDTIGIIPGSMGSCSYIVKGKGNADSFNSCSHGAGRRMSRGQAKREITPESHLESLRAIGLEVSGREGGVDESVFAYKNIHEVMAAQEDLIDILVELKPYLLPAIKGQEGTYETLQEL